MRLQANPACGQRRCSRGVWSFLSACLASSNPYAAYSAQQPADMQITDAQRRKLCEMMYFAFLEIRLLGLSGKAAQAADLAEAFHNLPKDMWKEEFTLEYFRDSFLVVYQQKYPEERVRDYLLMAEEIIAMGEDYSGN